MLIALRCGYEQAAVDRYLQSYRSDRCSVSSLHVRFSLAADLSIWQQAMVFGIRKIGIRTDRCRFQ
jgi:hypothetical protein